MKKTKVANILIVEDEPAVQELLVFNMKLCGHRVSQAYDAAGAMAHINRAPPLPDLILLDWMLPGISGVEFAKRLRADQRTYLIPIIMLTARTDERDMALGLESGADDYITKPFSPRDLKARVHAALSRHTGDETVSTTNPELPPATHNVSANCARIDLDPGSSDIMWS